MTRSSPVLLLIDGSVSGLQAIVQPLADGHEILTATRGVDGLHIAAAKQPDLVLLAAGIPDMDRFELLLQLRANPATRDIPVIFVTEVDEVQEEARSLDSGAADYVAKPIDPAVLRARVRSHLELKRQRDLTRRLSTTDELTGLPNHLRLHETLATEWRRALRAKGPLSLAMAEIDSFAQVNATYGYSTGDNCLREVAAALMRSALRPSDLIARYEGAKFACLLPETDAQGALAVARRFREAVGHLSIPHEGSEAGDTVFMSLGLATLIPAPELSPSDLIEKAEGRLLRAQGAGGNTIRGGEWVTAGPLGSP